jgi:hypothetical protein
MKHRFTEDQLANKTIKAILYKIVIKLLDGEEFDSCEVHLSQMDAELAFIENKLYLINNPMTGKEFVISIPCDDSASDYGKGLEEKYGKVAVRLRYEIKSPRGFGIHYKSSDPDVKIANDTITNSQFTYRLSSFANPDEF